MYKTIIAVWLSQAQHLNIDIVYRTYAILTLFAHRSKASIVPLRFASSSLVTTDDDEEDDDPNPFLTADRCIDDALVDAIDTVGFCNENDDGAKASVLDGR